MVRGGLPSGARPPDPPVETINKVHNFQAGMVATHPEGCLGDTRIG
jgi:hypothetical protein